MAKWDGIRIGLFGIGLLGAALSGLAGCSSPGGVPPDDSAPPVGLEKDASLIFLDANVVTLNRRQPVARAVAINRGKIIQVGDNFDVLKTAGRYTQRVEASGWTILPGFIDPQSGAGSVRGSIEVGQRAQLLLLARDPHAAQTAGEADPLKTGRVIGTVSGDRYVPAAGAGGPVARVN